MRWKVQALREQAEQSCLAALARDDQDSADAWEIIHRCLDDCQLAMADAYRTLQTREEGLNPLVSQPDQAGQ